MKTQKLLAKYVKVPAIRQLDKINSWANIFQKDAHPYSQHFYEGVNAHEKLEQAVEKAKADLRMRITGDGLFHYRYHPDKIPALVADTGDMAMHQGLALATAVVMEDEKLSHTLYQGSLKFIKKDYLVRGFNERGKPNLTPPSLDQLAGLMLGWAMYKKKYCSNFKKASYLLYDSPATFFLEDFIFKDNFMLKDYQGNYVRGMKRHDSPFLIDGDAAVMLAATALADYQGKFDDLCDLGLDDLAEYGHVHFLWWIAWYSLNVNMISLAVIYMLKCSDFALRGMRRLIKITDGWGMPFFKLLYQYLTGYRFDLEQMEQELYGYIFPYYGFKQLDREGKFLWWKWYKTPISPRAQINSDWFPQRGNHERFNNNDPDLWSPPYDICYARHDLIFQYEILKKLKGG